MIEWNKQCAPQLGPGADYIGLTGKLSELEKFWRVICPCNKVVEYGIGEFPVVDTPHPCGHPDHWVVKIQPEGT